MKNVKAKIDRAVYGLVRDPIYVKVHDRVAWDAYCTCNRVRDRVWFRVLVTVGDPIQNETKRIVDGERLQTNNIPQAR